MRLVMAAVQQNARKSAGPERELLEGYIQRAAAYMPVALERFSSEEAVLRSVAQGAGRTAGKLALFDGGGRTLTSEQFAGILGGWRDRGEQRVTLATGPASGWSAEALQRADEVISLGRMTLPHALAQVVVAEQIYRALTILAGHPYHCGH